MKQHQLEAAPAVELDIEAAFNWYEREAPGLGLEFIAELRAVYQRILTIHSDMRICAQALDAR